MTFKYFAEPEHNSRNEYGKRYFGKICCYCGDMLDSENRVVMKVTLHDGWDYIHEECLEDMSASEALDFFGIDVEEIDF